VTLAHLAALALDFARGAVVTLPGVLVGRAVVSSFGGVWIVTPQSSIGLLLFGCSVSAGILLRDLGGFRRQRVLLVTGMALGILWARYL
jgi:hypothetical protein